MSRYRDSVKNLSGLLGLESYGRSYSHYSLEELEEAIAEDNAEIQETEADLNAASDTMDELTVDAETVSNVSDIVEDSIESGEGLSEPAAAAVQEAVESIMRRHGMPRRTWPNFPSKESFSSSRSRLEASRRLKVSIEEGIFRKIWTGIKNLWEKIKKMFSSLWDKLFGKAKKTEEKINEDIKNVEEAKKNGETEVEVDPSKIANVVAENQHIEGMPTPDDAAKDPVGTAVKVNQVVQSSLTTEQQAILDLIEEFANEPDMKQIEEANKRYAEAQERKQRQAAKIEKFTSNTDSTDRVLNQLKTLKKEHEQCLKLGALKNPEFDKKIDRYIKDIETKINNIGNAKSDKEAELKMNGLLKFIQNRKADMFQLQKIAEAASNSAIIRSGKKVDISDKSFEKSNRRFGSFRRYSR